MKKKGSYGGAHHIGKQARGGAMHIMSHSGKDECASSEHHAANAAHGMGMGFCPPPGGSTGSPSGPANDAENEDVD